MPQLCAAVSIERVLTTRREPVHALKVSDRMAGKRGVLPVLYRARMLISSSPQRPFCRQASTAAM